MGHHQPLVPADNYGLPAPRAGAPYVFTCEACGAVEHRPDPVVPETWYVYSDAGRDCIRCPVCLAREVDHGVADVCSAHEPTLTVDEKGWGWVGGSDAGGAEGWYIYPRVRVDAWPSTKADAAVVLLTCLPPDNGTVPDGLMLRLDRPRLTSLIADLRAVERQLAA